MILQQIDICNFKNIASANLEFSPNVNGLIGNNGMGKSNLLDAIYFMSLCKSFTGAPESMLMRRGEQFTTVRANYLRRGQEETLTLGMAVGKRKSFRRQGKEYSRLSEHIGAFPLVMSSPDDIELIRGTAEVRRKLMDIVIAQTDAHYLDALIRYNRALQQRNTMLRDQCSDPNLYIAVEMAMDMAASRVVATRTAWIKQLTEITNAYHTSIAGAYAEPIDLRYAPAADTTTIPLAEHLDHNRRHDQLLKHTTVGPHRDDMELLQNGLPMRRSASQGQCKTFAIALRLAQYEFLHRANPQVRPLLLLDDIFDKLDATRVERIMSLVSNTDNFGQIFITDTNRDHLNEIMSRTTSAGNYALWNVNDGNFEKLH
ncbi:MAG: DNA replication and repair protein RecF [Muribaculum sp.]|nr:DNA replication and repair protein RecF [Muribaculaceae bacterium]MCM1081329.1 DNA replication and repair protein RecF [Muribaculum sp.]